jgi:gas vesicle protein
MEKENKLLIGLLAGIAAGVAIGLILAPEKGSDIREKMKDGAKKFADSLINTAEETFDKFKNAKKEV